jgi:CO dehydrogenase/acetyl-CoA synthase beta subunit
MPRKLTDIEANQKVLNHARNTYTTKTKLISEYKGERKMHIFVCGMCQTEFETTYRNVIDVDHVHWHKCQKVQLMIGLLLQKQIS